MNRSLVQFLWTVGRAGVVGQTGPGGVKSAYSIALSAMVAPPEDPRLATISPYSVDELEPATLNNAKLTTPSLKANKDIALPPTALFTRAKTLNYRDF